MCSEGDVCLVSESVYGVPPEGRRSPGDIPWRAALLLRHGTVARRSVPALKDPCPLDGILDGPRVASGEVGDDHHVLYGLYATNWGERARIVVAG
jgi:hypothetical protein